MTDQVSPHKRETLVIDEIGTSKEVKEAVGVQQRGVQLIATTNGQTLTDVIARLAWRRECLLVSECSIVQDTK